MTTMGALYQTQEEIEERYQLWKKREDLSYNEKIYQFNDYQYSDDELEYINTRFDTDGRALVFINSGYKYSAYSVNALKTHLTTFLGYFYRTNLAFTPNYFINAKFGYLDKNRHITTNDKEKASKYKDYEVTRTEDNLLRINCIAVDVDFKKGYIKDNDDFDINTLEFWEQILKGALEDCNIPMPTWIEYGHNIRLIFDLEAVKLSPKDKSKRKSVLTALKRIISVFCDKLNKYDSKLCCEPQKLNNTYRFPLSINTKDYSIVHIKKIADKYTFQELMEYLPDTFSGYQEWKEKRDIKVSKKKNVYKIHNAYQLWCDRREMFKEWRTIEGINRYKLCYYYGISLLATNDYSLDKVLEFNKGIPYPLPPKEIKSKMGGMENYYNKHKLPKKRNIDLCNEINVSEELIMTKRQREKQEKIENGTTRKQLAAKNQARILETFKLKQKQFPTEKKTELYELVADEVGSTARYVQKVVLNNKK